MKVLTFEDLKPDKGIPYSRAQLLRLERQGLFPRRIPLGPNRHGWTEQELDEWIKSRIRTRDSVKKLAKTGNQHICHIPTLKREFGAAAQREDEEVALIADKLAARDKAEAQ